MQGELSVFDRIHPDLQKELNERIIASKIEKIQINSDDDPEYNKKKLRTVNYMNAGFEAIYASNIIMLHQVRWYLIREGKYPDKLEEVDRWLSYINQCNDANEMLEYFDTHIPIYTSEYSESIGIEWDTYSIRSTIPFKTI